MTSLHVHTETAGLGGQQEEDSQMSPYMHHTPVRNIWFDLSKKEKQSKEEKLKFIICEKGYWTENYEATSKRIISGQFENNHLYNNILEKL